MVGFTFVFIILLRLVALMLAVAFLYALVFQPDAIGATVAHIILGFQNAMKGGA